MSMALTLVYGAFLAWFGSLTAGFVPLDACYFAFQTMSTVGLGDVTISPSVGSHTTTMVVLQMLAIFPGLCVFAVCLNAGVEVLEALADRLFGCCPGLCAQRAQVTPLPSTDLTPSPAVISGTSRAVTISPASPPPPPSPPPTPPASSDAAFSSPFSEPGVGTMHMHKPSMPHTGSFAGSPGGRPSLRASYGTRRRLQSSMDFQVDLQMLFAVHDVQRRPLSIHSEDSAAGSARITARRVSPSRVTKCTAALAMHVGVLALFFATACAGALLIGGIERVPEAHMAIEKVEEANDVKGDVGLPKELVPQLDDLLQ